MFVHVFDHDYCCINHRANSDGNAAKRHYVCVDALLMHDNECDQNTDGQTKDNDGRGTQVKQKYRTDQRDNQEFFQQFAFERFHGAVD